MPTLDFLFKRSSPTVSWCKILENSVVFSIKKKKKKGGMHSLHSISVRVVEFFKLALLRLLWISGQKIQLQKRFSDNVRRPCWPLRMWLSSYNGMCPSAVLTGSCRLSCCKYIAVWWGGIDFNDKLFRCFGKVCNLAMRQCICHAYICAWSTVCPLCPMETLNLNALPGPALVCDILRLE